MLSARNKTATIAAQELAAWRYRWKCGEGGTAEDGGQESGDAEE